VCCSASYGACCMLRVACCMLCCAGSTRLVSKQVRISGATTAALASATQHWPKPNLTKRTL
jgi:hypothetical protein